MLLAVDIGNTNIVFGIFDGEDLRHSWRISTSHHRTVDEYAALCTYLFQLSGLVVQKLEAVVISSVVPPLNEQFEKLSRMYFGRNPEFVLPEQQQIIRVECQPVFEVGADRIVNAIAALEISRPPIIVVDFGTATTFDAISSEGTYLGGAIAPGMRIASEALFARASKLPRIELKRPRHAIGRDTVSSMQSGIYLGYVSLVQGLLQRIQEELGNAHVIATGGLAQTVSKDVPEIHQIEEDLTLLGLKAYYKKKVLGL